MARLTDKQRLMRVLEFLAGTGHPEVRQVLEPLGFSEPEQQEGFRLLREATLAFHASAAPFGPTEDSPLSELDAWENRWLPIVRATLEHHFPDQAQRVLLNLRQTSGPALALTIQSLVDRLHALRRSRTPADRRAAALLERRGLGQQVLQQAEQTLTALRSPSAVPAASKGDLRAVALRELWRWYLEWSQTARAVLHEPALLRVLGFSTRSR